MEKGIKKRVALVGVLLVIGLMLPIIGSACGGATVLQGKPIEFEAKVSDGNLVLIQDGTWKEIVVENLTSEEDLILIEGSSDGIEVTILAKEKEEVQQPSMPTDEELLEIAEKDERVQELIAGKDYEILGRAVFATQEETIAILLLEVEGKYYEITIDLNNETVQSVRETFNAIILERAEDETPDVIIREKVEEAEDFDEILEKVEETEDWEPPLEK